MNPKHLRDEEEETFINRFSSFSKPKLFIPERIYRKIVALTRQCEIEISGFGRTSETEFGNIVVEDFQVFSQKNHPAHTSLDKGDLATMYYEAAKLDGHPEKWNFWWHSHVDMSAYFSGTDTGTLSEITEIDEVSGIGGTLIALCTNKKNEYKATMYKDGERKVKNMRLCIIMDLTDADLNEASEIIASKVTEDPVLNRFNDTPSPYPSGGYVERNRGDFFD